MSVTPSLVVVGRVNEGKTSIVSTLVEDDSALVGPEPGTTTEVKTYVVEVGGRPLLKVVDTPGFQEPERCQAWLARRAPDAARRAEAVRAFVTEYRGGKEFEDEWRLLEPVLDDGFVLYVVDASHPYRRSYESEMEILRWSGRPAIALVNRAGNAPYEAEWRRALQQHFNAVRGFNAHMAGFEDRVALLTLLAELDERLRAPLRQAAHELAQERERRLDAAAAAIESTVLRIVSLRLEAKVAGEVATDFERDSLLARYRQEIGHLEAAGRRDVERQFRHENLIREEPGIDPMVLGEELFVGEAWEFFGLSKTQLIVSGTLAGALGGLGIDAAVGGHSLGLGAVLGAGAGAVGTAALAVKEPRATIKLALTQLTAGSRKLVVGPTEHPNFPWVVLGRSVHHARLVLARAHARRDPLEVEHGEAGRPLEGLEASMRKSLARVFDRARRGGASAEDRAILRQAVRGLLVQVNKP